MKINETFLFRDVAGSIFPARVGSSFERLFPFSRSRRFSCQIVENSGDSVYGFNLGNHFADHLKQDQNRLIPMQAKRVGEVANFNERNNLHTHLC